MFLNTAVLRRVTRHSLLYLEAGNLEVQQQYTVVRKNNVCFADVLKTSAAVAVVSLPSDTCKGTLTETEPGAHGSSSQ